jgi:hypothetical protein
MSVGGVESRHAAVITKFLPNSSVIPPNSATTSGNANTTTTEKAKETTTTSGAAAAPAIAQVPGSFGPLTTINVLLGGQIVSTDPLGPNSFIH